MRFDHSFWAPKPVAHACRMTGLENVSDEFEIHQGKSRSDGFPADASFRMDPDFPDDTLPSDMIRNQSAFVLISERVKKFLEQQKVAEVEYLPVALFDHRDRPLKEQHFVVNAFARRDVLDRDACTIEMDFTGDAIYQMESFVLLPSAAADVPPIFRVDGLQSYLAVHRELANAMLAAGFTGVGFVEPKALLGRELDPNLIAT